MCHLSADVSLERSFTVVLSTLDPVGDGDRSPQIHVEAIGDEGWAEQMGARRISIRIREITAKSSPQVVIITLWVE